MKLQKYGMAFAILDLRTSFIFIAVTQHRVLIPSYARDLGSRSSPKGDSGSKKGFKTKQETEVFSNWGFHLLLCPDTNPRERERERRVSRQLSNQYSASAVYCCEYQNSGSVAIFLSSLVIDVISQACKANTATRIT